MRTSEWTSDELDRIASAEELQLASVRRDGTLRRPVTIWVVRHGDDLHVRSWHGRTSTWFRGVQDRHEGHIRAAYLGKYHRYTDSYVPPMIGPEARATTLRLLPRATADGSQ